MTMIKKFLRKTTVLFVLALVLSCSQDPIFFTIKEEPIPVKPRITGSPTNMVLFTRGSVTLMYVASGNLHWYAGTDWDSQEYGIPQPGDKVIGLAATSEYLYALCIIDTGITTVLRRLGKTGGWQNVPIADSSYTLIQSIYTVTAGSTQMLFAGAMNNSGRDFGVLYLDDASDNPVLKLINGLSDTLMLSGAASRNEGSGTVYFLSTKGRGVYAISETELTAGMPARQLGETENQMFMGMIQLDYNGPIILIERNGGAFFEAREYGLRQLKYSNGTAVSGATSKYATGALGVWTNINNKSQKILIAGIQGGLFSSTTSTSYSHGYVEIELDSSYNRDAEGWLVLYNTRSINPDITVGGNTDRYTATIGKHPVNHFFQTPESIDSNMTFFASTQTAGLWSYRDRKGGPQWNAEGENEPKQNINE